MTEAQAADLLQLLTWVLQALNLLIPLVGAAAFAVLAHLFMAYVAQ